MRASKSTEMLLSTKDRDQAIMIPSTNLMCRNLTVLPLKQGQSSLKVLLGQFLTLLRLRPITPCSRESEHKRSGINSLQVCQVSQKRTSKFQKAKITTPQLRALEKTRRKIVKSPQKQLINGATGISTSSHLK